MIYDLYRTTEPFNIEMGCMKETARNLIFVVKNMTQLKTTFKVNPVPPPREGFSQLYKHAQNILWSCFTEGKFGLQKYTTK